MAFALNPKVIASGSEKAGFIQKFPEAASQSFEKGQFVYLSSGKVTACASDATKILGIAMEDASGTEDTSIPVQVIEPGDLIRIRCYSTSGTAEVTCDNLTIGNAYGLVVVSNVCYADKDETTADAFTVIKHEKDITGAYTEWAYVTVLPAVAQAVTGA